MKRNWYFLILGCLLFSAPLYALDLGGVLKGKKSNTTETQSSGSNRAGFKNTGLNDKDAAEKKARDQNTELRTFINGFMKADMNSSKTKISTKLGTQPYAVKQYEAHWVKTLDYPYCSDIYIVSDAKNTVISVSTDLTSVEWPTTAGDDCKAVFKK